MIDETHREWPLAMYDLRKRFQEFHITPRLRNVSAPACHPCRTAERGPTIFCLPSEVILHILGSLRPQTVATFSQCSRHAKEVARSDNPLWLNYCRQAWGSPAGLNLDNLVHSMSGLFAIYPSIVPWPSELETEAASQHVLGTALSRPISFKVVDYDRHTVQYIGGVGQGNRAIRSTTPFPSASPDHSDETWLSTSMLHLLRHLPNFSPPTLPTLLSTSPTTQSALAAASLLTTHMRFSPPFTLALPLPFPTSPPKSFSAPWTQADGRLNVQPRLVAYYEVTIRPQELPNPSSEGPVPQPPGPALPPPPGLGPAFFGGEGEGGGGDGHGGEEGPEDAELLLVSSHCIAVGLASREFPLEGFMPGWDATSYAFHSDDGGIFHGKGIKVRYYGPSYGIGDVVGCGLDYKRKEIFFTLNGRFLGMAFDNVKGTLYPTVGIDSQNPVMLNFGDRPFVFDLLSYEGKREGRGLQQGTWWEEMGRRWDDEEGAREEMEEVEGFFGP